MGPAESQNLEYSMRFAFRRIPAAVCVAALALTASACTAPQPASNAALPEQARPATVAPEPAATRGVIVFDKAHGEIFAPEDTSELGQSEAVGRMKAAGYEVRVNTTPITAESLDGVAAVYVAGPMQAFSKDEERALDDYLQRGGTVILTIHVPYPVLGMPARWGLPVATGVMQAQGAQPGQDPGVFGTETILDDAITEGVDQVVVVSGWPVKTDTTRLATAKLVVMAAGDVAADTNANGAYDPEDLQEPFGIVGVAPVGSGRVVVMGDDGIFANMGIKLGDNARLLDNILELISAPKGA